MNALIFRLQLFKISESFIKNQVKAFSRYTPVFVGQSLFGPVPKGYKAITAYEGAPRLFRVLSQIIPTDHGLLEKLKPYAPRIIHAHFAVDSIYALPLAKKMGLPLVTTLHGFDVTRSNTSLLASCRPALVNSVLYRKKLQQSGNAFICVSNFIRNAALKKGYPENKLIVHYIGTDTDAFRPLPQSERKTKTIVHVARLTEKKGTIYLIRALAKLKNSHPDMRLDIVGDGPLRKSLEEEAAELGLGNIINFLGAKPFTETQTIIARSAMLVLPSITALNGDSEGLPMVTKEAGALGIPIVVTDSGGMAEAVLEGKTGYTIKEKDIDALADRIGRLLNDPDMAHQMGMNARSHIIENFNIKKQSQKLETIYDEIRQRKTMKNGK